MTANYRILYFAPDPEDGERIAVGLVFNSDQQTEFLTDSSFTRLRCLVPSSVLKLLKFQLTHLRESLRAVPGNPESILTKFAPQFQSSDPHGVVWPLTDALKVQLVNRFLVKGVERPTTRRERTEQTVRDHLRQFVVGTIAPDADIREMVTARWVLGQKAPQIKHSVSLAVKRPSGVILIDGVDLNLMDPDAVRSKVSKIVYTYFQYARAQRELVPPLPIKRVGILMNGARPPLPVYQDAHDFAKKELAGETDVFVDTNDRQSFETFAQRLGH